MRPMRTRAFIAGVGVFLAAVAAAAPPPPAREKFPDIRLTDLSGQEVELRNALGTATIIDFWATWCGPCRLELPELQKLSNEFGAKGLVVLAVDVDLPPAPEDVGVGGQLAVMKPRIEGFFKANDLTLPVFLLDGPTQTMLGVNQIPLSVLLDRGGNVVRVYPGFSAASMEDLRRELHGLLAERSGKGGK